MCAASATACPDPASGERPPLRAWFGAAFEAAPRAPPACRSHARTAPCGPGFIPSACPVAGVSCAIAPGAPAPSRALLLPAVAALLDRPVSVVRRGRSASLARSAGFTVGCYRTSVSIPVLALRAGDDRGAARVAEDVHARSGTCPADGRWPASPARWPRPRGWPPEPDGVQHDEDHHQARPTAPTPRRSRRAAPSVTATDCAPSDRSNPMAWAMNSASHALEDRGAVHVDGRAAWAGRTTRSCSRPPPVPRPCASSPGASRRPSWLRTRSAAGCAGS